MRSKSLPSLLLSVLFLSPVHGFAMGVVNGGGGKGLVCRNADQSILSVELLDLWEGKELHSQTPSAVPGDLNQDVHKALSELSHGISATLDGPNCKNDECFLNLMDKTAQKFLAPNGGEVTRLHGVNLELTDDSFELIRPRGDCRIEQIVNYQPGAAKPLVDQDLFEKMDEANQAALIAHEAFYDLMRTMGGDQNSLRVRRAVAFVFSGGVFGKLGGENNWSSRQHSAYQCSVSPGPQFNGLLGTYVQISGDLSRVHFGAVAGTPLIGVDEDQTLDAEGTPILKNLLQAPCRAGADGEITVPFENFAGPVEYDREARLSRVCHGKIKQYFFESRAPGAKEFSKMPISCVRQ